jgi:hypothetical protein
MKKLIMLAFVLSIQSIAYGKEIKKEAIGKKACSYSKTLSKEVCMREFRQYCSSGNNSLAIIIRACEYAVGGYEGVSCILGLIDDSELVYEPTKSQLQHYLEYKRSVYQNEPRTKCHIEGKIRNCLVREIGNFMQSAESFGTPLHLPKVVD